MNSVEAALRRIAEPGEKGSIAKLSVLEIEA
jgi:hypothetical protein